MHFKPFKALLDHFFQVFFMKKKNSKIFHTFCRRKGADPSVKFSTLFLTGSLSKMLKS